MTGPAKAIAASLGMTAFVVACLSGMLADNPAHLVLRQALTSMLLLYVVGAVLGMVGMYVVTSHVEAYKLANPIPDPKSMTLQDAHSSQAAHSSQPTSPGSPQPSTPAPGVTSPGAKLSTS